MRVWEEQLKRYERRVKKIEENPDPSKAASNKLLYEVLRDDLKEKLRAWDAGEPFGYVAFLGPAVGIHSIMPDVEGDRLGSMGLQYLQAARSRGYPDHGCDRCVAGMGIVLNGDLPPPAVCVSINYPCDPINYISTILGREFGCPTFALDIPAEESEEALNYLTGQIQECVKFMEENVPGARYDEDRLAEFQETDRRIVRAYHEVYELTRAVPCPVAGSDVFRLPPFGIPDPRGAEYAEMYRDELRGRVDRGFGAVKGEKLRFGWLVSGPYFGDPWTFLTERGVAVPFFEFGFSAYFFGYMEEFGGIWAERPFGRKLTPLEEEARLLMCNIWSGPAERRIKAVLKACRDKKIDALVHYQLYGCPNLLGSSKILADRAERELGIPSLQVEGWQLDTEKLNLDEFYGKLEDFITLCLVRKGIS